MNQPAWSGRSSTPREATRPETARSEPANLADILERVLDKGIVIAGDIRIDLLDIELLTIKIRLIVASVDRAREMGIDWWEHDPALTSGERDVLEENRRLRRRIGDLEAGRGTDSDSADALDRAERRGREDDERQRESGRTDAEPDTERRRGRGTGRDASS